MTALALVTNNSISNEYYMLLWLSDWQQGDKNLATGPKMENILNTHPISTPAKFELDWMKTFSANVQKPQINNGVTAVLC